MKKYLVFTLVLSVLGFSYSPTLQAKRRHRHKKTRKAQPKINAAAIKALMEGYTFGMTMDEVFNKLAKEIKKHYTKKILKARGDIAKDAIRKNMLKALRKLKKHRVVFGAKRSSWDSSIIDDQFAHRNSEGLIARLDQGRQKFFFFYNNRLYKIFIALNAETYKGFNFVKFQSTLEKVYGKSQEVFQTGVTGESELHHLLWKGPNGVDLMAMNKTEVYGNFVLILVDRATNAVVLQARKDRGLRVAGYVNIGINPMVKVVTGKSGN